MSNQPVRSDSGRVDHLAKGLLKKLLKTANPEIRFACSMFDEEIDDCITENLGPGTKAHEIGRRIIRAAGGDR